MLTKMAGDPKATPQEETTDLLRRWQDGDLEAAGAVLQRCYQELRSLARHRLRGERPDHTLEATDLVHEVFLRRLGDRGTVHSRAHFVGWAGQTMRSLLVDHARSRRAAKRGGREARVALDEVRHGSVDPLAQDRRDPIDLLDLDRALHRLEALDPTKARLVELRFFLGLDVDEAARALGMSRASAGRRWRLTRAWLQRQLDASGDDAPMSAASAKDSPANIELERVEV